MPKIDRSSASLLWLVITTLSGCDNPDVRLVELSERSLSRQAEQNHLVAQQSTAAARTTHQLVEADAKARQELITAQTQLQQDLQSERRSLDRQYQELEMERKQISKLRQRDPILAAAMIQAVVLVACLLPLGLCFFVLYLLRHEPGDEALGELLLQEFVDSQRLLDDESRIAKIVTHTEPVAVALLHDPLP